MSVLVEHKAIYSGCFPDCPRCAQDKIVALIKQKRDEERKAGATVFGISGIVFAARSGLRMNF